jgi:hypothetical protein
MAVIKLIDLLTNINVKTINPKPANADKNLAENSFIPRILYDLPISQ